MINELLNKRSLFLLLVLFLPFLNIKGQIKEGIYLIDDKGSECFLLDSAKKKLEIRKVLKDTYVISYSHKYKNQWYFERYYDEFRADYLNFTYRERYDEFKSGFLDTIYYWSRIYTRCCGSGNYHERNNTKTICAQKNDSLYNVVVLNFDDEIIQRGKSKYMYPLFWLDTLSFYQDAKLFKQIDYSNVNHTTVYFDKKGKMIEPLIYDSLMIGPRFPNSTGALVYSLTEYIRKNYFFEYPKEALDNDIDGNVYIRFIVTKEGDIECVEDLRRVPILSDLCVERVKTLLKVKPATLNGKVINVSCVYRFPFYLD